MFSTCIFCHSGLGRNEAIEHFPVGRRVAFDGRKGRLWAICTVCGRWNLSAVEERWEALEECEREFRGTSLRTSTENVGLARMRDGTDLVRIGQPLRPEFAAWRYGAQFATRHQRTVLSAVSAGGLVLGVGAAVAFTPLAALAGLPLFLGAEWKRSRLPDEPAAVETAAAQYTLRDDAGALLLDGDRVLERARMRPDQDRAEGRPWSLRIRTKNGYSLEPPGDELYVGPDDEWKQPREHVLTGSRALRALAVLLARANGSGGTRGQVQAAVKRMDQAFTPERFLARAEEDARKLRSGFRDVWEMPLEIRLAMEMAAHEDAERRALEGELAELERQWREAEEVAAIADGLTVPPGVDARLDEMRGKMGR